MPVMLPGSGFDSWSSSISNIRDTLFSQTPLHPAGAGLVDTFASCPHPQLSCHNSSAVENLCCYESPGGTLLQTQFWDTSPVTGPENSWTIHGLWPDNCGGGYDANCDHSRAYPNIATILADSPGGEDLLEYMRVYWPSISGDSSDLWKHEWSKHGTCLSTLRPDCFAVYQPKAEVSPYFNRTVELYKTLPTYEWLAEADIHPSDSQTYTASEIQSALSARHGGKHVRLGCEHGNILNEVWYYFNVRGAITTGVFEPSDPDSDRSSCPRSGIRYKSKSHGPRPTGTQTSHTAAPTAAPTGPAFSGKGHLNVISDGNRKGCIISRGTWYVSGACAMFTAARAPDDETFTLRSSKGDCAIKAESGSAAGELECGSSVHEATRFTANDTALIYDGSDRFTADQQPHGTRQVKIIGGGEDGAIDLRVEWEGVVR